jgi:hypothetical protein
MGRHIDLMPQEPAAAQDQVAPMGQMAPQMQMGQMGAMPGFVMQQRPITSPLLNQPFVPQAQMAPTAEATAPRSPPSGGQRVCKFGRGCTRPDCWFVHPEGRDIDTKEAKSSVPTHDVTDEELDGTYVARMSTSPCHMTLVCSCAPSACGIVCGPGLSRLIIFVFRLCCMRALA